MKKSMVTTGSYLTVTADIHIKDVSHLNIDCAEKSLVPFLELFLVKDLYRQNALIGDVAKDSKRSIRIVLVTTDSKVHQLLFG